MDEMNENDVTRQIERDVEGNSGLIALSVCLAIIAGILIAGSVVLIRQFS
jgi:hypothetical protein